MSFTEKSSVNGGEKKADTYLNPQTACLFCMIGLITGKIELIGGR